jgi:hypothetical protein
MLGRKRELEATGGLSGQPGVGLLEKWAKTLSRISLCGVRCITRIEEPENSKNSMLGAK